MRGERVGGWNVLVSGWVSGRACKLECGPVADQSYHTYTVHLNWNGRVGEPVCELAGERAACRCGCGLVDYVLGAGWVSERAGECEYRCGLVGGCFGGWVGE